MSLSELIRLLADLAEIAVTILLAYVAFKIAKLVEAFSDKIREGRTPL